MPTGTGRAFELARDAHRNGMGDQAHDFFRASGALTVVEYRPSNEALLHSSKIRPDFSSCRSTTSRGELPVGARSVLGLQGLVTPEDWRAFCADRGAAPLPSARFEERNLRGKKGRGLQLARRRSRNAKIRLTRRDSHNRHP